MSGFDTVDVRLRFNYDLFIVLDLTIFVQMNLSSQNIASIRDFFSGRPIKKAYIFGSFSRNEADENSDIDILVELDHSTPIGMQFFTYGNELQHLLKKKVDLVTYEGISKYVKPFIDKEKVLIYEKQAR